jgi:hypothetical protein
VKATFSRWLAAIAHTFPRHVFAAAAQVPARRKLMLAATGLTAAAALAGGQVAAGAGLQAPTPAAGATPAAPNAASQTPNAASQTPNAASQTPNAASQTPNAASNGPNDADSKGSVEDQPAAPAEDKVATPPANKPAAPSIGELIPYGTQGPQSSVQLSPAQLDNARTIVRTAKKMGVGERGAVIGVATSLQESKLINFGHLGYLNDHDSLGLFQQRPSSGWGTPDQITNPEYAASAFFNGLKRVNGWQNLPLADAAQTVQVSAYPFAYAQWEQQAANIVHDVWND